MEQGRQGKVITESFFGRGLQRTTNPCSACAAELAISGRDKTHDVEIGEREKHPLRLCKRVETITAISASKQLILMVEPEASRQGPCVLRRLRPLEPTSRDGLLKSIHHAEDA
jgi:hypothetical protein